MLSLDTENLTVLFERLLSIFHHGTIVFFGDSDNKVDLSQLTENDFLKIDKYFNSFGIGVNYKIIALKDMVKFKRFIKGSIDNLVYDDKENIKYSQDIHMYDLIKYNNCKSPNLNDYRICLKKEEGLYIIWFNFLK